MVIGDDVKHRHHTVIQPPLYASLLIRDKFKHFTRLANAPIAVCPTSVSGGAKQRWYVGDRDKYRSHTVQTVTWANAMHFAMLN